MKKLLLLISALSLAFILCACANPEKAIVGTWEEEAELMGVAVKTVYVFNEDGTGTIEGLLDIKLDMNYTVEDNILTVSTKVLGIQNDNKYEIEFNGDKLLLTDSSDATIILEKVK
jgi:hypothetical protein